MILQRSLEDLIQETMVLAARTVVPLVDKLDVDSSERSKMSYVAAQMAKRVVEGTFTLSDVLDHISEYKHLPGRYIGDISVLSSSVWGSVGRMGIAPLPTVTQSIPSVRSIDERIGSIHDAFDAAEYDPDIALRTYIYLTLGSGVVLAHVLSREFALKNLHVPAALVMISDDHMDLVEDRLEGVPENMDFEEDDVITPVIESATADYNVYCEVISSVLSDLIEFMDLDQERRKKIIGNAYSECIDDEEGLEKIVSTLEEAQMTLLRGRMKAASAVHSVESDGPIGALFVTVGYME